MKPFNELNQQNSLKWVASGKLQSELQTSAGEILARLTWKNPWSSLATGEAADGMWTLKRAGFLRPKVTLRKAGTDSNTAEMQMSWNGGGEVILANGSRFQFRRLGFWNPELNVFSEAGKEILSVKLNHSGREGSVILKPAQEDVETKSLLAILSWYVIVLASEYDTGYEGAIVAIMAG